MKTKANTTIAAVRIALRSQINVLLHGKPGRGKSQTAMIAAHEYVQRFCYGLEAPIVRQLTLPEDTPASILMGGFRPNADGSWQWQDGPAIAVCRHGGVLILDEIANASPEATTLLHMIMDGTPELTLHNGEVLQKAPMVTIATQNDDPDALRPALLDRLPIRIPVNLPDSYEWLGAFATAAEADLTADANASLRPWAALKRATDNGVSIDEIVPLLWPNRADEMIAALKLGSAK